MCLEGDNVYTDNTKSRGGIDYRDSIFGFPTSKRLLLDQDDLISALDSITPNTSEPANTVHAAPNRLASAP